MEENLLRIETDQKTVDLTTIDDGDYRLYLSVSAPNNSPVEVQLTRYEARRIMEALEEFLTIRT
jgi:hypothetical protein